MILDRGIRVYVVICDRCDRALGEAMLFETQQDAEIGALRRGWLVGSVLSWGAS